MEVQVKELQVSSSIESPVSEVIGNRRSLRAYSEQPVEQEKINSLFEAARWAPSSMNEQPWTYVYATKDQPALWSLIFESLNESNKIWAEKAPLLVASLVRKKHLRNNQVNQSAKYDVGAANAFLSLQATELGLNVHQLGGYDREKLIRNLNVPMEDFDPVVVLAIGYPGNAQLLPEHLKQRELAPRYRYVQSYFVKNQVF
jgi:nitroreductase